MHSHRTQRQMQAHRAGSRDQRRRLAGGGCGQRPGGRRFALGEAVGSGCKREGLQQQMLLMGGGSIEGANENIHKIGGDRWGGRVIIKCVISNGA